ncbi:MAG: two-component system response regulator [Flavobacteriaceae bacterium]|nr:two-component system response regulator [Flavobacteriaceae bacterium]
MHTTSPTVLLIEDSINMGMVLCELLGEYGFQAKRLNCVEEFYSHMYQLSPDLVVMDMLLYGLDACSVAHCYKQKEDFKHVPLIMMSAHPEGRKRCLLAGADDYIPKPFSIEDLIPILHRHLHTIP